MQDVACLMSLAWNARSQQFKLIPAAMRGSGYTLISSPFLDWTMFTAPGLSPIIAANSMAST
jgi:hypothetical protein